MKKEPTYAKRLISLCLATAVIFLASPSYAKDRALVLNKDITEKPLPVYKTTVIEGYLYKGELPPFRKDAPWYKDSNRVFVENLPMAYHEAMFFNNEGTFREFVKRFKGVLKSWERERALSKMPPEKARAFYRKKLDKAYRENSEHLKRLYPGLTERQYRLLIAMNLAHGHYVFDTQAETAGRLTELVGFKRGDCSELASLTSALASVQGIDGRVLSLRWDYQTPMGRFFSGHQVFYAEGLWLDAEINAAFRLDLDGFLRIKPRERFPRLVEDKAVLGFYNWHINPEVRSELLKDDQDGGTIAFYYYYYFEGLGQGAGSMTDVTRQYR